MPYRHTQRLLVEGAEDKRVVPELVEEGLGIEWGESEEEAIVSIKACDGFSGFLKRGLLEAELKASGLEALGILADANDNPNGRWESLRNRCQPLVGDFPDEIVPDGLVLETSQGIRFGIWLMPDNTSRGMLETFLGHMVSREDELWAYAQSAATEAGKRGAPFKDAHRDKAEIHTWLAWQDPPGRQLHHAVMHEILDLSGDRAKAFLSWFQRLFDLTPERE